MNDKRNKQGNFLPDTERLTVMGKFVPKTSLDEIPQLLNVIYVWADFLSTFVSNHLDGYNHERRYDQERRFYTEY